MRITSTHVNHIRNLRDCSLSFSSSANFIFGPNGAGKTALIEAIYIMSRGQSFRGGSINDLISNDSKFMSIKINLKGRGEVAHSVQGSKHRSEKLKLNLDELDCKSFEDVGRLLPVQLMVPNESELIYFGPEVRRSFLDWGLFHVEQGYLDLARAYRRVLRQRNAWLKNGPAKADPWVKSLVELGVKINGLRAGYVRRLGGVLSGLLEEFSGAEKVLLDYWGGGYETDLVEASVLAQEAGNRDAKAGSSSLGPHRADMRVYVSGKPAKTYCSRGQAKLVSLCLALSQAINLQNERKTSSVLLIDDIGAELDQNNLIQCLELIKKTGMQVFITASSSTVSEGLANIFGDYNMFHVEQGEIFKEPKYGH